MRRFRPGDQVYGASMWKMSCCAEYICLPETGALAPKPSGVTHREAVALVDGPCTALHFLRNEGVLVPVIDRVYPLAEVAQAHRYVAEGRKRGSVAIDVSPAASSR